MKAYPLFRRYVIGVQLLLLWALLGCNHSHQAGHDHGHGHGHGHAGDHGHGHNHGGPNIAVTKYTERTELFMEYPPLVSGQTVSFLAHLTVLGRSFQAVQSGQLRISFVQNGAEKQVLLAPKPLRTGIFKPTGKAPAPGQYRLVLRLTSPQANDTIVLPGVQVYAKAAQAKQAAAKQTVDEGEVSFLKEQQWNIPFANMPVSRKIMRASVEVLGVVQPLPGKSARLTSPIAGLITWMMPQLQEGTSVKKGQLLLRIEPQLLTGVDLPKLQQSIATAKTKYQLARWELQRLQRMAKERAVAKWQLQRAEAEQKQWLEQWQAAKARLRLFRKSRRQRSGRGHAVTMVAPLRGVVSQSHVTAHSSVEQGQPILSLVDGRELQIVAYLPEAKLPLVRQIDAASVRLSTHRWLDIGKPASVGVRLDPSTRTLPLFFKLKNPGLLWVGQNMMLQLHFAKRRVLAVPQEAIVDDQGSPVVFVQKTGESFAKRRVTPGIRERGWVELKAGIGAGERVVVKGAYEILLTQALKQGGGVGHGHAH